MPGRGTLAWHDSGRADRRGSAPPRPGAPWLPAGVPDARLEHRGIVVLAIAAVTARSVALAGLGLDSLIEIGASTVVVWELSGTGEERQRRGLRLIGYAFAVLAFYLLIQSTVVLAAGYHPRHSPLGIAWTAVTAIAMFALAAGKARTGRELDNPVLRTEGRVTTIDRMLAAAVLLGLALNAAAGWWWADPAARVRAGLLRRPRSPRDLRPRTQLIPGTPRRRPRGHGQPSRLAGRRAVSASSGRAGPYHDTYLTSPSATMPTGPHQRGSARPERARSS
jgi:hypothetical protein